MPSTLGISIGTRTIGIAVLVSGELVEFRVRTFPGKWSSDKAAHILRKIEKVLTRYMPSSVVIKSPHLALCSDNIRDLLEDISLLFITHGIKVTVLTNEELKAKFSGHTGRCSRDVYTQQLVSKYPELRQGKTKHSVHFVKLLEAVACAEIGQRVVL